MQREKGVEIAGQIAEACVPGGAMATNNTTIAFHLGSTERKLQ